MDWLTGYFVSIPFGTFGMWQLLRDDLAKVEVTIIGPKTPEDETRALRNYRRGILFALMILGLVWPLIVIPVGMKRLLRRKL